MIVTLLKPASRRAAAVALAMPPAPLSSTEDSLGTPLRSSSCSIAV
jgi:hypothetical protein